LTNDSVRIETHAPILPSITEDAFGFRPTVDVNFDRAPTDEGIANLYRTVDWLVNLVDGDAVLMYNEYPVLLRSGGKVWLDRAGWNKRLLPLLTFDYDWKVLPHL
jgi:hypothetical protein